jgi:hypothetical protein
MRRLNWKRARAIWAWVFVAATVSVSYAQDHEPSVVITQIDPWGSPLGPSLPLQCERSYCVGLVAFDIRGALRTFQAAATFVPDEARIAVEPKPPLNEDSVYVDRNHRKPMVIPIGPTLIASKIFWLSTILGPNSIVIKPRAEIRLRIDVVAPARPILPPQ